MPIYEYECKACHRRTEKRQKFSDPEITACPHCGGAIERVLSAPAFSFAGGGWYKDLYSSAKPPAANAGSGEAKSEGSGDAKPAGKTEAASANGTGSTSPAPAPAAAAASSSSTADKK